MAYTDQGRCQAGLEHFVLSAQLGEPVSIDEQASDSQRVIGW